MSRAEVDGSPLLAGLHENAIAPSCVNRHPLDPTYAIKTLFIIGLPV